LRDALAERLEAAGKAEWACQEFAAELAARPPAARPDPWRRTSGIHRVRSRRGLAVVRELWLERDAIAQQRDLSPGRVLPDAAIIEAALTLPTTGNQLTVIPGFTGRGARGHIRDWLAAISRARARPEASLPAPTVSAADTPPPASRWAERDPIAARRLAAVRAVITAMGESRNVPAENLLPPDAVRRLAWRPPEPLDRATVAGRLVADGARPWQVELTAAALTGALREAAAAEDAQAATAEAES